MIANTIADTINNINDPIKTFPTTFKTFIFSLFNLYYYNQIFQKGYPFLLTFFKLFLPIKPTEAFAATFAFKGSGPLL